MTAHRLHNTVYARLEAIAAAEKITRSELGNLSRELLVYVPDTQDIDIVNRLLGVLTPMNRKTAILFFTHFLPWQVENDADGTFNRFGKMLQGEKKIAKRMDAITEFLKDESNNIWTWADENVQIDKKKDFKGMIAKAIKKALEGDEKSDTPALSKDEVFAAIFDGGITLEDLLVALDTKTQGVDMSVQMPEAAAD